MQKVLLVLSVLIVVASCACSWDDAKLKPWSAASSWPNGVVPACNADVIIGKGMSILLDVSTPPLKSVVVENGGRLVWGNINKLNLKAAKIQLRTDGQFWVGSADCFFTKSATITRGDDKITNIAHFAKVIDIAAHEGLLELHQTARPRFNNKRASTNDTHIPGLDSIPSNFNTSDYLDRGWPAHVKGEGAPDTVGAFRFICNPSHIAYDDPIVYPGKAGASHLHQFFGNSMAYANSTYETLRKSGNSTCANILNRSAYWMPALLDGQGSVVHPDFVSIYYKRYPVDSKYCSEQAKACVRLPRGLRYIFGFDMVSNSTATGAGYFNCQGPNATSGHYPNLAEASKNCPPGPGNLLGTVITAPSCWDGQNLDSPNHRSHVEYPSYGWWGYLKCPDTHPWIIPTFTLGAWFQTDSTFSYPNGTFDNSTASTPYPSWHFSSDEQFTKRTGTKVWPGTTFHSDWFGAWDDDIMKAWGDNCIDQLYSCSAGDLGNTTGLKGFPEFSWTAKPYKTVIPTPPSTTSSSSSSSTSSSSSSPSSSSSASSSASSASSSSASPSSAPIKTSSASIVTASLVLLLAVVALM